MVQAVLVELPLFNGKMAFGFLLEAGESFKLYKFVFKLIWEGSESIFSLIYTSSESLDGLM